MKSTAPAASAATVASAPSRVCAEIISTLSDGFQRSSAGSSSSPSMPGIATSSVTRSGSAAAILASASLPLAASPTTRNSGSTANTRVSARRTKAESSTRNTRITRPPASGRPPPRRPSRERRRSCGRAAIRSGRGRGSPPGRRRAREETDDARERLVAEIDEKVAAQDRVVHRPAERAVRRQEVRLEAAYALPVLLLESEARPPSGTKYPPRVGVAGAERALAGQGACCARAIRSALRSQASISHEIPASGRPALCSAIASEYGSSPDEQPAERIRKRSRPAARRGARGSRGSPGGRTGGSRGRSRSRCW